MWIITCKGKCMSKGKSVCARTFEEAVKWVNWFKYFGPVQIEYLAVH